MSWPEQRARFPVLERHAYLNAGTFGPLARETLFPGSTRGVSNEFVTATATTRPVVFT